MGSSSTRRTWLTIAPAALSGAGPVPAGRAARTGGCDHAPAVAAHPRVAAAVPRSWRARSVAASVRDPVAFHGGRRPRNAGRAPARTQGSGPRTGGTALPPAGDRRRQLRVVATPLALSLERWV